MRSYAVVFVVGVMALGCATGERGTDIVPVSDNEIAYTVRRAETAPVLDGAWDDPVWRNADVLTVDRFHEASSDHRPRVQAKLLYTDEGIHVIWRVADRYILCRHTAYQDPVYKDSCVEFFVQPKSGKGYFNFEMNCGGTLLLTYIEKATRTSDGFEKYTVVPWEWGRRVKVYHSMPEVVDPEITEPREWVLQYFIPFALLEAFVGPIGSPSGQEWRANFYKCADACSHPHWAGWAPIGKELNFHQPDAFAPLRFQP